MLIKSRSTIFTGINDHDIITNDLALIYRIFKFIANKAGKRFDPDVLTITWARRFADYKRAWLILMDKDRINKLLDENISLCVSVHPVVAKHPVVLHTVCSTIPLGFTKLADANSKDRMKCEIYITEGDSASGNLKLARDNETQAILPVRGKILNVRKATLDKIQKNAEIMNMIEAFGLTVDKKTMKLTFNKEDLRYGKIIIMSDADVDGEPSVSADERLFA